MDNLFFQAVLNSLDEQLAILDQKGIIVFVNDSWIRFGAENGVNPEYGWIGTNYIDVCKSAGVYGDSDALSAVDGICSVLTGVKKSFYLEYPCHSPSEKRWYILRATPVKGFDNTTFVLTHQNITQRKLAEQAAEYSSLHDALTALSNRRHFDSFLSNEWRRCLRSNVPVCVLMLDLDRFKPFNDENGHIEGDKCLKNVANIILSHATRGTDISARFGGDEFSVVLGDTPAEGGSLVANRILADIRNLDMKISSGEMVSASIGLACRLPGAKDCTDEAALIALADSALYKAKSGGRNRIEVL